ncbi:unnamed protein product, partial [Meganyctiphanes norvegica]
GIPISFAHDGSEDMFISESDALRDMVFGQLAAFFRGGDSSEPLVDAEYKVDKCMKMCPKIFLPLCGSDGRTYGNKCVFEIEHCRNPRLKFRYHGMCKFADQLCTQECPNDFEPICGTDGITYPNKCMFLIAGCKDPDLRVNNLSACTDDNEVLTMLREWKGSNNNHNGPPIHIKPDQSDEKIFFDEFVQPLKDDHCTTECPDDYEPICGTDGITYPNMCTFIISLCRNPQLQIKYLHPCSGDEGSDEAKMITYDEPGKLKTKKNDDHCTTECPDDYEPICGTDGITYPNMCTFIISLCRNPQLQIKYLQPCSGDGSDEAKMITYDEPGKYKTKKYDNPCTTECPNDYEPICGTDGITYPNMCTFIVSLCRNPKLQIKSLLPCSGDEGSNGAKRISLDEPGKPKIKKYGINNNINRIFKSSSEEGYDKYLADERFLFDQSIP